MGQLLSAQFYSYKQLVKEANSAYEQAHFIKAIDYYQQAIELNKDHDEELLFRLGDAAFQTKSLTVAQTAFDAYLENASAPLASEAIVILGRIAQTQGNYAEANRQYDLYLSEYEDLNPELTENIKAQKAKAEWALNANIENEVDTIIRLGDDINSPNSDNAPFYHEGQLYYSSLRFPIEKDKYNRYVSKVLKDSEELALPGVNSDQLVSNPAFNKEGTELYFTICSYENVYQIKCEIYKASVDPTGTIGHPTKLPESINSIGASTSHPALQETAEGTVLYFSSNRVGGKGGTDIWMVEVNDTGYGQPSNLFSINTDKDELTPFYHNDTEALYFSSNGHNGYGGHDVFRLLKDGSEAENMGDKVNSSYDDVHYFLTEDASKSYFCSNRPGSLFPDNGFETCCFDIYSGTSKECNIDLKTLAFDAETKEPLADVNVKIYDKTTGEVFYNQAPTGNETMLTIPCEGDWALTASRDKYEDLELDLSDLNGIHGVKNQRTKELYLKKDYSEINLTLEIYEEVAKRPIDGADVYLTNANTMEQVSQLSHADHIFNFPLIPNTDYILEVNKEGFKEKTLKFNSGFGDLNISKEIILDYLDVVQKSIVSLENAIPVSLYFDNDSPDPRTTKEVSSKTYTETFDDYYARKDKFKNQYLSLFKSSDKVTANDEIEYLFQSHIKKGFDRYDNFKRQLLIVLESGQDVNIYLKGYASPIAQSEYNAALGKRRVDSIRKEFDSWNNGALLQYIRSGQLKVTERSFGETTAAAGISDDPSAPSKSIYSPQASLERRVEIEEINFNQQ